MIPALIAACVSSVHDVAKSVRVLGVAVRALLPAKQSNQDDDRHQRTG